MMSVIQHTAGTPGDKPALGMKQQNQLKGQGRIGVLPCNHNSFGSRQDH